MPEDSWWEKLQRRFTEFSEWAEKSLSSLWESKDFSDFFVRLNTRIKSLYKYAFANKNVLIFGPKGAGKTSLIGYLKTGQANVTEHDPTAGVALVDRAFEIDNAEWLKIQKDVGGDQLYRHLWPTLTKAVDPDSILFVLDGRKSMDQIELDMKECLHDALSEYGNDNKRLKLIYVLVNFYDVWGEDSYKKNVLCSKAQLIAAEQQHTYPALRDVTLRAFPTHINPQAARWGELDNALEHFAKDSEKL